MNRILNVLTFAIMASVAWIGVEIYSYDLAHPEQFPREISPAESATTFFIAYMPMIWLLILHVRNKFIFSAERRNMLEQ